MPRLRLAVTLVFALGLAIPATRSRLDGSSQPIEPVQPVPMKPGDTGLPSLSVVPTDAFGFVSVKVSKLWDNPAAKPLRDWYSAQKQVPFEDMIGIKRPISIASRCSSRRGTRRKAARRSSSLDPQAVQRGGNPEGTRGRQGEGPAVAADGATRLRSRRADAACRVPRRPHAALHSRYRRRQVDRRESARTDPCPQTRWPARLGPGGRGQPRHHGWRRHARRRGVRQPDPGGPKQGDHPLPRAPEGQDRALHGGCGSDREVPVQA